MSVDVKRSINIDFDKENNKEGQKFKFDASIRKSKFKITFAQGYVQNWYEEDFMINKVKNTVSWTYVTNDLNGEEIVRTFNK